MLMAPVVTLSSRRRKTSIEPHREARRKESGGRPHPAAVAPSLTDVQGAGSNVQPAPETHAYHLANSDDYYHDADSRIAKTSYHHQYHEHHDVYGDGSFTTPTKWWVALGGFGVCFHKRPVKIRAPRVEEDVKCKAP